MYLGMSAGVGKTYAMLSDALQEKARGRDVVAGYVEPHDRAETSALAKKLESLSPRQVRVGTLEMPEFDLDAALVRAPELLLIDELAHTNAPGSRHLKRWQDIDEILGAGISVATTVNIQHLESLRDVVGRITGVQIQETIPDAFLIEADEVEVVDIPPDELLQRLREGKIYAADRVEQALRNFFMKGNLLALRELLLRHAAERVDAQLRDYREEHFVRDTWPTTERIIVCVAPNAISSRVVRAAARIAQTLHAELIGVSIENSRYLSLAPAQRQQGEAALRLAQQLGAIIVQRSATDIVSEIVAIAKEKNATAIVVGKPLRARWKEWWFGSVVDEIIRTSGDVAVYVVSGGEVEGTPISTTRPQKPSWRGSGFTLFAIALCTGFGALMRPYFDLANIIMIYLVGVLWVASRFGRFESIVASIGAVAAFDFFFVPPQLTFVVADIQYLITFVVMLFASLMMSSLTLRLRVQADLVRDRERRTAQLYQLTRRLSDVLNQGELLATVREQISEVFHVGSDLYLPNGLRHVSRIDGDGGREDSNDRPVAQWVFDNGKSAGQGTETLSGSIARFLPLSSRARVVGVLALRDMSALTSSETSLLEAFCVQIAGTVERLQSEAASQNAKLAAERERLRNTLLSTVSHDLRTPLSTITGAASTLVERETINDESRRELGSLIVDEAQRLSRIIRNVLDISRLESGIVLAETDWISIEELIGSARSRLRLILDPHPVTLAIAEDLPLIRTDGVLLEQVLINVLENAAKYSPVNSPIEIRARTHGQQVLVEIADRGVGVPAGDEERIFEKLYRGNSNGQSGFGLGLAIARAIMFVLKGTITMESRSEGGSLFRIQLPLPLEKPEVIEEFRSDGAR